MANNIKLSYSSQSLPGSQTFRSGEFITWLWWFWVNLVPLKARKMAGSCGCSSAPREDIHTCTKSIYYSWPIPNYETSFKNEMIILFCWSGTSWVFPFIACASTQNYWLCLVLNQIFALYFQPQGLEWGKAEKKKHVFNCWAMSRNIHILVWQLASWPYHELECAWICYKVIPNNKTL